MPGLLHGLVETIKGPGHNPLGPPKDPQNAQQGNTQPHPNEKSIYDTYKRTHPHNDGVSSGVDDYSHPPHGQPAPTPARRSTPRLQPIIAIPQIGNGQGVPFIRAYTRLLSEEYEISENDFLRFIDGLNTVVIPSVEADIAKKAIKIGSHFVPGVGALAVNIGGQAVPVIGDKLHLSYCTKHFIATANAQLFNPVGLEATLCSSANLDQFTGVQSGQEYGMDPVQRLQSYGTAILHFDELLAPAQRQGWHERVSASVAQNEAERNQQKVMQKMQRGRGKGQNKADQGEGAFKWLVIKTVGDTGCISQPQQYLGYD